jgi:hypothetical protein
VRVRLTNLFVPLFVLMRANAVLRSSFAGRGMDLENQVHCEELRKRQRSNSILRNRR